MNFKNSKANLIVVGSIVSVLVACHTTSSKNTNGTTHGPAATTNSQVAKPAATSVTAGPTPMVGQPIQLTFVGPRAGEGYFSPNGEWMTFQSERAEGNPFYQIYLMNMKTGQSEMVSTGKGRTTCSWIHPIERKVLFSSTHLDPKWEDKVKEENEMRNSGKKAKYSWSYDDQFDIFARDLNKRTLTRLTNENGYDAEAAYSPDGQEIVFASNRTAYVDNLSAEDKKRRDEDPSYFMEIYSMKADGSQIRRLTEVAGYDGGPFFSPDGKLITWRRFTPDGRQAEVWVMNRDGSGQKELTHLHAMSWAPFFHPSGDYLIFTTNVNGYDNFELYIVDRDGRHQPVRVSYLPGFDGLPVFTPDGQNLTWTRRNEKGDSQIYMVKWDDQAARRLLELGDAQKSMHPLGLNPEIRQGDLFQWVRYLASTELNGRPTGGSEEKTYLGTIAKNFSKWGLQPLSGGQFEEKYQFASGVTIGDGNSMSWVSHETSVQAKLSLDWMPFSISASGDFKMAPVVFAGYGIVAPASSDQAAYDSYGNLSVKDKWVMVLKDIPQDVPNAKRFQLNLYARLQHKALVARQRGAVGLVVISDQPNALRFEGTNAEAGIPVLSVSRKLAESWLLASGKGLASWMSILDKGQTEAAELSGLSLAAKVKLQLQKSEAANVVGILKVPGAKSSLLIGAHGDHLGHGDRGDSLARADEKGQIHFGADDNASGVASVLELAHHFASQQKLGKLHLKQNLIFAVWTGEELGVLGSAAFVKRPNLPSIRAMINLDMVGRLRDQLMVQGTGSAKEWPQIFEELATRADLPVSLQSDPYLPTDSLSFYLKKIPAISLFTGSHLEYHSPRDRVEMVNYEGLEKVALFASRLTEKLATSDQKLTYEKVEGSRTPLEGRGFRLYLGTVPDYSQEGIKGVRISGTTKSSPAEKAGLLEGDVIVSLGGIKIDNIQDYVYCLQSMKANEKTPLKVVRQGKLLDLEIVPTLKGM